MKMTKQIEIINVLNEKVIVEPIAYNIALMLAKVRISQHFLLDMIMDLLRVYAETPNNELKENIDKLKNNYDSIEKIISDIREKNNYWYSGVDNLEEADKERYDIVKMINN